MRRARLHLQSEISSPSVERSGQTPGNFQPLLPMKEEVMIIISGRLNVCTLIVLLAPSCSRYFEHM